jgi:hypothetical protein
MSEVSLVKIPLSTGADYLSIVAVAKPVGAAQRIARERPGLAAGGAHLEMDEAGRVTDTGTVNAACVTSREAD